MIKYEDLKKVNNLTIKNRKKLFETFWNQGMYILGNQVKKFEKNFSKFLGIKFSIGVNSGYDAIYLAIKTLKLPEGSEIILSSCSYIATVNAVIANNCKPIFVEANIDTYNIDVSKIESMINKKTKAIIITHLYGRTCEMKKILNIKRKHKLYLIEDCAQSHGSKLGKKYTGTFGDFGCFSFYPTKNLGGLGDGGLITTNNRNYANNLKKLRNYGFKKKNYSELIGINSRLDDFQAIFLNAKLKSLRKMNLHKIKLAKLYDKLLTDRVIKPFVSKKYENVYHIYPIRYEKRNKLISHLSKNGIQVMCHYPLPPHKQISLKKFFKKKYPISEKIHKTIISLPISYSHSEKDVKYVCKIINKLL